MDPSRERILPSGERTACPIWEGIVERSMGGGDMLWRGCCWGWVVASDIFMNGSYGWF